MHSSKFLLLCVLLYITGFNAAAQTKAELINSLPKLDGVEKARVLVKLSDIKAFPLDSQEMFADEALDILKESNEPRLLGRANYLKSFVRHIKGDLYTADSLLLQARRLAYESHDTLFIARANLLLSYNYLNLYQYDSVINVLDSAEKYFALAKDIKRMYRVYFQKGFFLDKLGRHKEAIESYIACRDLAWERSDTTIYLLSCSNLSSSYKGDNQFDKGIEAAYAALNFAEEIGDMEEVAKIYMSIGLIYKHIGASEKALEYYDRVLEYALENRGTDLLHSVYANIATCYMQLSNRDSSLYYTKLAWLSVDTLPERNSSDASIILYNYGQELFLSEQYDTALITLLLAKDRYENHGMKYYSMGANGNIGLIYAYKGNRAEAMKYYNAAFDYFDEHPDAEGLRHLNAAYAKGLAAMGDFKLAFEYYERYLHLHDSISRANTKQNVEEIEARYQNQKKEKENALLRSEKAELELSLQKEAFAKRIYLLVIGLFVIASIFAIVLIISIKRSDRKLRQQYATIREKNLKIQLLLREIHHHVKNNLNTIRSMLSMQAQKMDDGQTREVIQNIQGRIDSIVLVHKLLYVQDYSDNLELKRYLSELCKSIFQLYDVDDDKISLKLDLDDKLINKNECVNYGLMVNELVSNALKYAFPKNRPGEISVSYTENPGNIIISVSDNGVGYNVDEEKDEEKGFGLKMTEMIAKSYNGVLKVISTNEGTICKIIIPDKPIS